MHELPAQAAERAAVRLQHLQGRWLRLGSGGQGSAGLEEGALGPAQAQGRGLALLGEQGKPGLQLVGDDYGWAQVDAGEIVGPGLLIRPAAVVGPVLDQDQALLAQGGEVLLHGALVASSKARDRGVAGGEHRRAAQAPAAVEGQEGTQGADHAGAQAELTSAFLEHPACGCGVRQGGGEALVGCGTLPRDRRSGAARGHAQGWPSLLVQLSIVLVMRSHAPVHARRRAPAGGRCATRTTVRACAMRQHAL